MPLVDRLSNTLRIVRQAGEALTAWLGQAAIRRRIFIIVTTVFVTCYAVAVFRKALVAPEIGLRQAFTPIVMRVLPDFVRTIDQERDQAKVDARVASLAGMAIARVADREVESWPELLRVLADLRERQPGAEIPIDAWPTSEQTHIRRGSEEWVRVELVRLEGAASGRWIPQLAQTREAVKAGGPRTVAWVRLGQLPLDLLVPSILWFVLKAGLVAVGALVYWKRPDDRSAGQFFVLSVVTFGAYMGGYHWSRLVSRPELLLVFILFAMLLPAVSLHFYLVFPRPKAFLARHGRWLFAIIYGVPLLFLLALVSGYLRVRWLFHSGSTAEVQELLLQEILYEIYCFFGVAALWYVASAACLAHSYLTADNAIGRNQVKWILYGVAASLLPIGYTLYLAVVQPDDFGSGGAAWPMFLASVCVTFAFAVSITRYRLMQLDQIVSSGVRYFLFSALAGVVYYTVVFAGTLLFHQWIARPSLTTALGVSASALVLMLVMDWLRGHWKRAEDLRLFREKYQLDQTLRRMSRAIEQLVEPPTLARRLLQEAAELLGATRGAVYLREGDPALYRLASSLGHEPTLSELPPGCPLLEAVGRTSTLADGQPDPSAQAGLRQLRFLGGEVGVALAHEGQTLALLLLGPREAGPYGPEELNLLASLAQVGVLALVSAVGHRTIDALNRELQAKVEKIAEQQRRILALQSQLQLMQGSGPRAESVNGRKDDSMPGRAQEAAPGSDSGSAAPGQGIIGSSPQVLQLLALVRKVSDSQATVLIRGESGTGKELLARALHDHSPRASKPFVKVHCAALSPGLLESELFGHVKGAYTGAHRDKMGRFELAAGGTVFLDEIGDISLEVQTKLLRVLQEMTFERVGSSEAVRVDVRVIAATHQNLEQLIREGRFREDLFYRLNVISLSTPPLRERREDIPELVESFLRTSAQRCGRPASGIDDDALAALKAFDWPGNIRQLENVIERAVVVAEGPVVTLNDLPPEVPQSQEFDRESSGNGRTAELTPAKLEEERQEREHRERRERDRLVRALAAASGNKAEAARALGLARSTLLSRLRKHGLQ